MCRPQNILQWGGMQAKSEKQQTTASLSDRRSEAAFGRFASVSRSRLTGDTISSANGRGADLVPWRGTDQPSLRGRQSIIIIT
ncbi:hypothetical protein VTN96DRAFT_9320 [Rasamsonia emersonii]